MNRSVTPPANGGESSDLPCCENRSAGVASSLTPSKGKVKMTYNDGSAEERTSSEEIAFINIKLVKVGFSGSGNRVIRSDDGGTDYSAPHWNDPDGDGDPSDGHAYPVRMSATPN